MGKMLKQQRRGKGSPAYKAPSHRYKAKVRFRAIDDKVEKGGTLRGEVAKLIDDPGRQTILMQVKFENKEKITLVAPEGIAIGDEIHSGFEAMFCRGSVLPLQNIPDGTYIFNVEMSPGDGGKIARTAGTYATIAGREKSAVFVRLPSKKTVSLQPTCRAQIGICAGGGRLERPLMKAGANFYKKGAQNRRWPVNRGVHQNPYTHPHGGKQHHIGKSSTVARGAPPGSKVGHLAARSTGRRKGRSRKR